MSISKDFVELINTTNEKGTKAYDTSATVTRVEDSTVWVHIPGGVDETPVKKTINAKAGDVVQVRVSGGSAWLNGNASAPPTDDTKADVAIENAEVANMSATSAVQSAKVAGKAAAEAQASATTAYNAATAAQTSANNALVSAQNASEYASRALGNLSTVQSVAETLTWITQHGTMALTTDTVLDPTHVYFVVDPVGDYVVGGTHYSIVAEPDVADIATYYELTIDESLNNYVGTHLALTGDGLWLLPATSGTNKVLIATGAGTTYTVAGTYLIDSTGGTVASFRANGATIGEVLNGQTRTEISTSGMQIYQRVSGADTVIANLGYGVAYDPNGSSSNQPYYTFGERKSSERFGAYSLVQGYGGQSGVSATAACAHATGYTVNSGVIKASGLGSHAEGEAQGHSITASGTGAHAEGVAINADMVASGSGAHAEGEGTTASNYRAHAEGFKTTASGIDSHAQNSGTIADQDHQTAIGTYNTENNIGNLFVIGNGYSDNNRSDAFTVDSSGNVNIPAGANYCINNVPISGGGGGGDVTGVKGNAEQTYRTGNVNLTPANIGAIDTAGSGLTKSGTTLKHTNTITAQTTQAVYPIKIDAEGHISAYGSAVTIPTVNNGTLTIQKNSANIATFTANASSNVTANISVPTDTGDLTNGAGYITSADIPEIHNIPSGGATGQVLTKDSGTDYDVSWETPKELPIGSIYECVTNTNPSSELGNTWDYLGTSSANVIYNIGTSGGDSLYTSDGYNLVTSDLPQETYKFVRTA